MLLFCENCRSHSENEKKNKTSQGLNLDSKFFQIIEFITEIGMRTMIRIQHR